jgi:hypothetical protein
MGENRESAQTEEQAGFSSTWEPRPEDRSLRQPASWEAYDLNILTAFFDD